MTTKKAALICAALILASVLAGVCTYPYLPSEVTTHWSAAGVPNGDMSKFWGIFLLPIIAAGLAVFLFLLPALDPLDKNFKAFRKEYDWLVVLIETFLALGTALVLAWNLGARFDVARVVAPAIGILFFFIGMLMPEMKRNWFAGIRTPWTMSSDRVWKRTHEQAGSVFQLAGIIACIGAILPQYALWLTLVPILLATLWVTLYSYLVYRKGE